MSPLGAIKQQQREVHLVPPHFRDMTVKHYLPLMLQHHKTILETFLDVLYACLDLQASLRFQVVVLLEDKRQYKPSGCIDFAVIDLMVPCDN